MSYGFKVTGIKGKVIVEQGIFPSKAKALDAAIQYINENDIWDCKIDVNEMEVNDE